ncbi:sigma-54-dependent transcriptional regulator [Verrucomicrobiota bacterium]
MARILVVDDEAGLRTVLSQLLKSRGHAVAVASDGPEAVQWLSTDQFDIMVSDIRMNPMDGLELLEIAHKKHPELLIVMLTAYSSVASAIESLKLGAFDYLTKPFKVDELLDTIDRALEYRKAVDETEGFEDDRGMRTELGHFVAASPSMKEVFDQVKKAAPTEAPILVLGESGTGKTSIATAVHTLSPRRDRRFLCVNCATFPEPLLESEMFGHVRGAFGGITSNRKGVFEVVRGGTVVVDEVTSMPWNLQGRLLDTIRTREIARAGSERRVPVDARVVACSNVDIGALVAEGRFLQELHDTLGMVTVEMKPLRERREDIVPLIDHFVGEATDGGDGSLTIDADVYAALEAYSWPGNVQQLENLLKRIIRTTKEGKITREMLPPDLDAASAAEAWGPTPDEVLALKGKAVKAYLGAPPEAR